MVQLCFRCDVLLLVIPLVVHLLIGGHLSLFQIVYHGCMAAVCSLVLTVMVDSWFWGRWLWPEGEVFYFNAILQK